MEVYLTKVSRILSSSQRPAESAPPGGWKKQLWSSLLRNTWGQFLYKSYWLFIKFTSIASENVTIGQIIANTSTIHFHFSTSNCFNLKGYRKNQPAGGQRQLTSGLSTLCWAASPSWWGSRRVEACRRQKFWPDTLPRHRGHRDPLKQQSKQTRTIKPALS